jgi:predicted nucleic-acid-binding protein
VIAIDTNVLVRLLVSDDAAQTRRASALFDREEIGIATTVLLETEWVLRAAYRIPAPRIEQMLRAVLGLPMVSTQMPQAVAAALDAFAKGLDFADALHLFAGDKVEAFYSFDSRLRQRAMRLVGAPPVAAP